MAVPIDRDIPDLTGWMAYCSTCDSNRAAERVRVRDTETGEEYFEFVCDFCHSILLTFHRKRTQ